MNGPTFFQPDEERENTHDNIDKLCGWAMAKYLTHAQSTFDKTEYLETTMASPDDSEPGFVVRAKISHPIEFLKNQKPYQLARNRKKYIFDFSQNISKFLCQAFINLQKYYRIIRICR